MSKKIVADALSSLKSLTRGWVNMMLLLLIWIALPVSAQPNKAGRFPYYAVSLKLNSNAPPIGSAFFATYNNDQYLITAKHVVADTSDVFKVDSVYVVYHPLDKEDDEKVCDEVWMHLDIKTMDDAGEVLLHPTRDVAVFAVGHGDKTIENGFWTTPGMSGPTDIRCGAPTLEVITPIDSVEVGGEIWMPGYPTDLIIYNRLRGEPIDIDINRPLLRGGIVAGKNERSELILVDAPAFGGNSGGPILYLDLHFHQGGHYRVSLAGIVSKYVPNVVRNKDANGQIQWNVRENSGITVVEPMDFALELMQEHDRRHAW